MKKFMVAVLVVLVLGLLGGLENDVPFGWFNGTILVVGMTILLYLSIAPVIRASREEDRRRDELKRHVANRY